jgi:threonine dehydratase
MSAQHAVIRSMRVEIEMPALFDRIMDAHASIRPQVRVTPLDRSNALSTMLGCDVLLKGEHLQPTGSFKVRGATNKIRCLGAAAQRTGVITASTGNHGQAAARAGALAGVAVTVYVSASTVQLKKDAIEAFGAKLVVIDGEPVDAELQARRAAETSGIPYISPYNDLDVVAGQGTLGAELVEQTPDLDAVFIAVGGGGLIGGTGTVLKRLSPNTRVIGVWPESSPALLRSLEAGRIIEVNEQPTLSDGTAGGVEPGSVTFPICQAVIDTHMSVTEAEIASAMRLVAHAEHWIVEGAAGVAVAGLVKQADLWRGRKVAVVLCGRNIAFETFLKAIA